MLIPVLDNEKHYWIGEDEIKKLLKFGEGWLASHPEKNLITHRYLKHFKSLVNEALEQLSEDDTLLETNQEATSASLQEESLEKKINLNQERIDWVINKLKTYKATTVLDLGCGEGKLISKLLQDKFFQKITGSDVCLRSLQIAKERLKLERLPSHQQKRIALMHSSLAYRDRRFSGYDAITLIEVIEHMDLSRLNAFKRVIFEFAKPKLAIITTPNSEYNVLFENLPRGKFRHADHRFEWTRQEFEQWAQEIANQFGYSVAFEEIGASHPTHGSPTQAGIFTRND